MVAVAVPPISLMAEHPVDQGIGRRPEGIGQRGGDAAHRRCGRSSPSSCCRASCGPERAGAGASGVRASMPRAFFSGPEWRRCASADARELGRTIGDARGVAAIFLASPRADPASADGPATVSVVRRLAEPAPLMSFVAAPASRRSGAATNAAIESRRGRRALIEANDRSSARSAPAGDGGPVPRAAPGLRPARMRGRGTAQPHRATPSSSSRASGRPSCWCVFARLSFRATWAAHCTWPRSMASGGEARRPASVQ